MGSRSFIFLSFPMFLCDRLKLRSFFLGDVSPSDHMEMYVSSVKALMEEYWNVSENENVLIVNTHGWTRGEEVNIERLLVPWPNV